jgi:ADP-ribosylglycohydrolase
MARAKTLGDVLGEATELKQRAAVHDAVSSWLRTYYTDRDSSSAQKAIVCDGAPVPEKLVLDVVMELEGVAKEMRAEAAKTLSRTTDG